MFSHHWHNYVHRLEFHTSAIKCVPNQNLFKCVWCRRFDLLFRRQSCLYPVDPVDFSVLITLSHPGHPLSPQGKRILATVGILMCEIIKECVCCVSISFCSVPSFLDRDTDQLIRCVTVHIMWMTHLMMNQLGVTLKLSRRDVIFELLEVMTGVNIRPAFQGLREKRVVVAGDESRIRFTTSNRIHTDLRYPISETHKLKQVTATSTALRNEWKYFRNRAQSPTRFLGAHSCFLQVLLVD